MALTVLGADAGACAAADTTARMIDNHQQSLDLIVCSIPDVYNIA
ncbi:hypothetical protein RLEG3_03090 (plasmid) [Rhizobium leguminosarum bv. trifolii WSM1689]|nr:hypothetical protein RLEG3_03090 [Rhizobium leguminosarum bv. trifolii WSM1689]